MCFALLILFSLLPVIFYCVMFLSTGSSAGALSQLSGVCLTESLWPALYFMGNVEWI